MRKTNHPQNTGLGQHSDTISPREIALMSSQAQENTILLIPTSRPMESSGDSVLNIRDRPPQRAIVTALDPVIITQGVKLARISLLSIRLVLLKDSTSPWDTGPSKNLAPVTTLPVTHSLKLRARHGGSALRRDLHQIASWLLRIQDLITMKSHQSYKVDLSTWWD